MNLLEIFLIVGVFISGAALIAIFIYLNVTSIENGIFVKYFLPVIFFIIMLCFIIALIIRILTRKSNVIMEISPAMPMGYAGVQLQDPIVALPTSRRSSVVIPEQMLPRETSRRSSIVFSEQDLPVIQSRELTPEKQSVTLLRRSSLQSREPTPERSSGALDRSGSSVFISPLKFQPDHPTNKLKLGDNITGSLRAEPKFGERVIRIYQDPDNKTPEARALIFDDVESPVDPPVISGMPAVYREAEVSRSSLDTSAMDSSPRSSLDTSAGMEA